MHTLYNTVSEWSVQKCHCIKSYWLRYSFFFLNKRRNDGTKKKKIKSTGDILWLFYLSHTMPKQFDQKQVTLHPSLRTMKSIFISENQTHNNIIIIIINIVTVYHQIKSNKWKCLREWPKRMKATTSSTFKFDWNDCGKNWAGRIFLESFKRQMKSGGRNFGTLTIRWK